MYKATLLQKHLLPPGSGIINIKRPVMAIGQSQHYIGLYEDYDVQYKVCINQLCMIKSLGSPSFLLEMGVI